ncbi:nucleotide-binding universal stress UspA family protein [Chitinophaga dinghuensis]|uniref:Nucleotide-binding universal stress UspA family protein n=1 Tax=Chitinophaga dinghuensis TaxID=1539050 RepID=A0A327VXS2_9BACT|nr:universal stress protein [Chitinophaga dinghuensis]RAJ80133.1 nucleotide-binding universal stress UspA family protein [Chitinophaga dinghuensis]
MKVLVPTDFSEAAFNAAKYAVTMSSRFQKADITLYHSYSVLHLSGIPMPVMPEDTPAFKEKIIGELNKIKEQLADITPRTTTINCETDVLPLLEGMQQIIDIRSINMVIMGITGKSGLQKTLIGSNTLAVTQHITIPVIIIPTAAAWKPQNKILFAYNKKQPLLSRQSNAIEQLVTKLGAHLDVLYVGEDVDSPAVKQEIEKLLHVHDISYHTARHHKTASDILHFAEKESTDMLLAIPGKYSFLEDLFHKSVTKELAYKTHIPLIVIG